MIRKEKGFKMKRNRDIRLSLKEKKLETTKYNKIAIKRDAIGEDNKK